MFLRHAMMVKKSHSAYSQ